MKFFIPFGYNFIDEHLEYIEKFKNDIAGFYFGNKKQKDTGKEDLEFDHIKEIKRSVEIIKNNFDIPFEFFYVGKNINSPKFYFDELASYKIRYACDALKGYITGLSVSNFSSAVLANQINPDLKIDISVNTLMHEPVRMTAFKEYCNLYSINPPRSILRYPEKLKWFYEFSKKNGVKIKAILNELCRMDCPFETHCFSPNDRIGFCAKYVSPIHLFKSNWVLPSYFKQELSQYVDIGKIVFRNTPPQIIYNCLNAYKNGDDNYTMNDFLILPRKQALSFFSNSYIYNNIHVSDFPKKVFSCGCNDCYPYGKCKVCMNFIKKHENPNLLTNFN